MNFCIGCVSRSVVDSVIEYANTNSKSMILIPSRRQIDLFGGYIGWRTEDFANYVRSRTSHIRLERDHGGPSQGVAVDDDGFESLTEDCKYFDIIHIDPWKKYPNFEDGLEWTVKMIEYCYKLNPSIRYEVGTEQGIRPFEVEELNRFIVSLKELLSPEMFEQIEFIVIQCGTQLIEKRNCGEFNESKLTAMLNMVASHGKKAKEHNGDWVTMDTVHRKAALGIEYINIAPEMGEIETAEILKQLSVEHRENMYQLCLASGNWRKWVSNDFVAIENKEKLILIGGHYIFTYDRFIKIRALYPDIEVKVRESLLAKITELHV